MMGPASIPLRMSPDNPEVGGTGWVMDDVHLVCMSPDNAEKVVLGGVIAKRCDWVPPGKPVSGGGVRGCVRGGSPVWVCPHNPERAGVVCVQGVVGNDAF